MSPRGTHAEHAHDEQHGDPADGVHATFGGYLIGFVLSVILTAVPFWLVMGKVFESPAVTTVVILAIGVVQIFVHLVYFLHMNTSSEERWNLVALVFTVLIIAIVVVGSLWIMYNLNINMMVH